MMKRNFHFFVSSILVDHRNDQWITENRLSSSATPDAIETPNDHLNDSTNSLTGRKRARLKRRLNEVTTTMTFERNDSLIFF